MPSIRKITVETFTATVETVKHPLIGSVISNTEDTTKLLDAFMQVLADHNHADYAQLAEMIESADEDDDQLDNILDMVYTAMESLALDGYYFGADGMGIWNYGFWVKTW